ncbi:hypothetical protein NL364_31120, partial [Klebsiella pneumoniae]|nr:hypothetical protein [Klebsiella pneumoniae]
LNGTCAIGDISDLTEANQRVAIGAPVRGFDVAGHFDRRTAGQLDRFSQFAAVAARQAWADSGLAAAAPAPHRLGVAMGT